jgi:GMP synthase (glutamine-hydrolysing)
MAIIVFEHSHHVGVGRLGATLRDYGHKLRFIRPHEGQALPADLDDVDGVITCGGPQSANDGDAWISDEFAYLRDAVDAGLPVIGNCLGAQMLAKALGGEVAPLSAGSGGYATAGGGRIELGWHRCTLSDAGREDVLHTGLPWSMPVFQWHREQVTTLPPGAKLLASSSACKVQTWMMGLRVYGFQYMMTVDPPSIDAWIGLEPEALAEADISADELRAFTGENYPAFHRLTQRLFESIALFLMPVDRRIAGVVKDLHH